MGDPNMKLLPMLALPLLVALGGLTSCGDDTQDANISDRATTSASAETESSQETEDAPAETQTAATPEATNPHVIAYCGVARTMATLQEAEKDFGAETAKLSGILAKLDSDDMTPEDHAALSECSDQVEEVYKKAG
jgi:hypothetical protein